MKASESQANIFCDRLIEVYNEQKKISPSLKQKDIAIAVDIPAPDIHKYFAKKIKTLPDAYRIYVLANYFDVSQAWLMGLDVPKYNIDSDAKQTQDSSEYVVFPVMGEIAAGYEKVAIEDWDGETIPIHISNLKGRPKDNFLVLEVKGNSMFPEFQNGDKVLIQKQDSLDYSGQVGAIMYNDDCATLKKIEYKEGEDWIRLVPINPTFETERIDGHSLEHCKIIGVPKMLIREYEQ